MHRDAIHPGEQILVIDDDEGVREVLTDRLEMESGINILTASSVSGNFSTFPTSYSGSATAGIYRLTFAVAGACQVQRADIAGRARLRIDEAARDKLVHNSLAQAFDIGGAGVVDLFRRGRLVRDGDEGAADVALALGQRQPHLLGRFAHPPAGLRREAQPGGGSRGRGAADGGWRRAGRGCGQYDALGARDHRW